MSKLDQSRKIQTKTDLTSNRKHRHIDENRNYQSLTFGNSPALAADKADPHSYNLSTFGIAMTSGFNRFLFLFSQNFKAICYCCLSLQCDATQIGNVIYKKEYLD